MPGVLDGVTLHKVDSLSKAMAAARWAGERREGPLFFDTESAGLNPYRDKLRMVQLGDLREGWAFPPEWTGAAQEILTGYTGELGAHNSPYDNRVLRIWAGIEPRWERTHDSMTVCSLSDSVKQAGLKPRSALEIDSRAMIAEQRLADGMAAQRWTWGTVPFAFDPYWQYGALDPVMSAHLFAKLGPEVLTRFAASYDLERATARICAGMMDHGMMIDREFIDRNIAERLGWLETAMTWLREAFSLHSVESNDQVMRCLNQAGVPTIAWTESGQPSIAKDTLKMYAAEFPHAAPLINIIATARKTTAVVGRYLEKFLQLADADGIIHCSIHPSRARTGRMSITDPPMQTYDRDEPVVRGCYIPRPGHVFITIDADQIEARLGAHFSGDQRMIADFKLADETGQKFFIIMASKIFGEKVTKTDPRYTRTKNATYGQIYGAGLEKAAATAGVPLAQMRAVYEGTQQLYPGLNAMMNRIIRENKHSGHRPQVLTWGGRRLYADRGHEYALMNYKIQGTAAEILKRGQVDLVAAGFGPYLCLDVHDEFIIEAPRDQAEDMLRTATDVLTDRESFSVPITWAGSILEDRWRKT
jgi:DNA polymerase I